MFSIFFRLKYAFLSAALVVFHPFGAFSQNLLTDWSKSNQNSFVTEDSVFLKPYIDIDEWREKPLRHHYVHGGFEGTSTKFSFYFPEKEKFAGHFFQYITPVPDDENLSQQATGEEDKISFSISHGAYFVETNGGGVENLTKNPSITAYRANAATALFSKVVAGQIYNRKKIYGYAFGGSGGAYRTVGGIENTDGVWDGVVPFVLGTPQAIPNYFTIRMLAMRILHDKFPFIIDALEPGGNGDPYLFLNTEERAVLNEATKMGFPPQAWFGYKDMGVHGFMALYQAIVAFDKKYFEEDFWNKPGYEGFNPSESLMKAIVKLPTKIEFGLLKDEVISKGIYQNMSTSERGTADAAWKSSVSAGHEIPIAFQLADSVKYDNFLGGDLKILSGKAKGSTLQIAKAMGNIIILGPADAAIVSLIENGDSVEVNNLNFLAVQTYHRHQVPSKDYKVWNQFRDSLDEPIYPQRSALLGAFFTRATAGGDLTGKFKGKMILLESLWDREALPWSADWYYNKVKENLGNKTDDNFRLWYMDRALHGDATRQENPAETISYLGILQQALLDLSDWVEKGIAPAASTSYKVIDGQVILPQVANARKGIQPVVHLHSDNQKKVLSSVGKKVLFEATVEVPQNTGKIVKVLWCYEDSPRYALSEGITTDTSTIQFTEGRFSTTGSSSSITVKGEHVYYQAGTYFPTLLVIAQRNGDKGKVFTKIQNLDRMRVVVQ